MATIIHLKEKRGGRYEIIVTTNDYAPESSDVQLTFTRRGVEITGHYDHFVGIESGFLSWEEIERIRTQLIAKA